MRISVYVNWRNESSFTGVKQNFNEALGTFVRDRRKSLVISQVEFCERCGFYQTYISRVESEKANPTLNKLEVFATALALSILELFNNLRKPRS